MLGLLIEDQIRRGAEVFDFLKGDEQYKFRLGAEKRPLFRLQGRLP
jgi:CelD/BcsL family acetyltransferase involved in cellulose biosynthesis